MNALTLSAAQKLTLKNYLLANHAGLNDEQAAIALNAISAPDYWVWKTSVSRAEIYHEIGPSGTAWDWTVYKNQGATEQNAWVQMFMGDNAPFHNLNLRAGVHKIFGAGAQRTHIFAAVRRKATVAEKLLAVAVTSVGSITVDASNGNVLADTLGGTTNPALLGVNAEGHLSASDVSEIRQ